MGLFKKIGAGLKKIGKTLGKGAGLLAKGAIAVGKTILGVGDESDTKTAKATASAAQSIQELAALQKAQLMAGGSGALAGGAKSLTGGKQAGVTSRFQMAIVWDWIRTHWYVPIGAIIVILGIVFWRGQASGSRKYKKR